MIDGVVTTVDAVNGAGTLDRQPEAVKQAAVADRLIVTKADLAEPAGLAALEARLKALNPGAPLLHAAHGAIDPGDLFGLGLFDPQPKSIEVQRWLRTRRSRRSMATSTMATIITTTPMGTTSTGTMRASAPSASPASGRSRGGRCRGGSMRWRRCAATICCG